MNKKIQIANVILEQMGGHRFVTMTGAKNLVALENGLQFQLPSGGGFTKQGINCVSITLDLSDTYTVSFKKIRKYEVKTISEHSNIYVNALQELFTAKTGLDTYL